MDSYNLSVLRVGHCIPSMAIQADGCVALFLGETLCIFVLIDRPDPSILRDADVARFGIRLGMFTYGNTVMLAVKPGNLPWHDAPYSPHLSMEGDIPFAGPFAPGTGMVSYYFLVDSSDGRILQIKPFVLSNHFSNSLISALNQLKEQPFDLHEFRATVDDIQRRYSPRELGTTVSQDRFRLEPSECADPNLFS